MSALHHGYEPEETQPALIAIKGSRAAVRAASQHKARLEWLSAGFLFSLVVVTSAILVVVR